MQKKNLVLVFLLVLVSGLFIYPRLFAGGGETITVSDLTANPNQYLGKLTVSGSVAAAYPDEGVFVMVDAGGCCSLAIVVPMTEEQKTLLEQEADITLTTLFTGAMPSTGSMVEVSGTLKREQNGMFLIDVDKVNSNGKSIISRAN